jgi:hypothetical protein
VHPDPHAVHARCRAHARHRGQSRRRRWYGVSAADRMDFLLIKMCPTAVESSRGETILSSLSKVSNAELGKLQHFFSFPIFFRIYSCESCCGNQRRHLPVAFGRFSPPLFWTYMLYQFGASRREVGILCQVTVLCLACLTGHAASSSALAKGHEPLAVLW